MASQMTETLRNRTLFEVWLHLLFAVPSSPQSQIMIVEWRHSQTVIVKRLRTSLLSNERDLMPENESAKNQTEYSSELTQKSNFWCISSRLWQYDGLVIDFCATDLYLLCMLNITTQGSQSRGVMLFFSSLDWLRKLSVELHLLKIEWRVERTQKYFWAWQISSPLDVWRMTDLPSFSTFGDGFDEDKL